MHEAETRLQQNSVGTCTGTSHIRKGVRILQPAKVAVIRVRTMRNSAFAAHEGLLLEPLRFRDLRALHLERARFLLLLEAPLLQGLAPDERAEPALGLACEAAAARARAVVVAVDVRGGRDCGVGRAGTDACACARGTCVGGVVVARRGLLLGGEGR